MGATSDGKVFISIAISDNIILRTNVSSYTDAQQNTLIAQDSKLYNTLSSLTQGRRVHFSGTLLKDGSPNEATSMITPEYIILFTDIKSN